MVVRASVVPALIPTDPESLGRALDALSGVEALRLRLDGREAWLVGGAVRDLLLGGTRADLDVVVERDAAEIAALLGAEPHSHERFGTASVDLEGTRVDVARARRETYPHPGALPDVEPATLRDDLRRRDFTVNAMALPLLGQPKLIDPHGGQADLHAGLLRVLHSESFVDDPTRSLRAARYAARLGFAIEPETLRLLNAIDVDLGSVSADRILAELKRIVSEDSGPEALELLVKWGGIAGIDSAAPHRVRAARELVADPDWAEVARNRDVVLHAAAPLRQDESLTRRLVGAVPESPSHGVSLLRHAEPYDIVAARLAGAEWLDGWARSWRKVRLEIGGDELMEAGIAQGPAVGRGLEAALAAKLDGDIATREEELRVALAAAAAT
jgi:tRNA nucleotidyltransferase (CCA-adding enzyme)